MRSPNDSVANTDIHVTLVSPKELYIVLAIFRIVSVSWLKSVIYNVNSREQNF